MDASVTGEEFQKKLEMRLRPDAGRVVVTIQLTLPPTRHVAADQSADMSAHSKRFRTAATR